MVSTHAHRMRSITLNFSARGFLAKPTPMMAVEIEYWSKGPVEWMGQRWHTVGKRVRLDMKHFRRYVMRTEPDELEEMKENSDDELQTDQPGDETQPEESSGADQSEEQPDTDEPEEESEAPSEEEPDTPEESAEDEPDEPAEPEEAPVRRARRARRAPA